MRVIAASLAAALCVAGCGDGSGRTSAGVYQLRSGDLPEVQVNMLDAVNFMRSNAGLGPVQIDARLTAAAQAQADDMSRQQRAWGFASDGSNPYTRVSRSGYGGRLVTELYAQSFESELQTLTEWMKDEAWSSSILNPAVTDMGLAFHQDRNGMLWWVLTLGTSDPAARLR